MDPDSGDATHGTIEHIIVLMLENRSFDHLLGNVALNGTDPPVVNLEAGDRYAMPLDPGHSHAAVMQQLGATKRPYAPTNDGFVEAYLDKARGKSPELRDRLKVRLWFLGGATSFAGAASVEWPWVAVGWLVFLFLLAWGAFRLVWRGTKATGHLPRTILEVIYGKTKLRGLLIAGGATALAVGSLIVAVVTDWVALRVLNGAVIAMAGGWLIAQGTKLGHHDTVENSGDVLEQAIVSSFTHDAIEPLADLAKGFATCTRWFCPVPGETWPNRNFVHAGTSDGAVDIEYRLFDDDTIFERLQDGYGNAADRWRVYFEGVPQVLAFSSVWEHLGPDAGAEGPFRTMEQLWADIDHEDLSAYSFIEPFHGTTLEGTRFAVLDHMTNSQHSGNNKIAVNQYKSGDHATAGRDFIAGMKLVAQTYQRLREKPELFDKTVLVITYDEHGGFADHVPPPVDAVPPRSPGIQKRVLNWFLTCVYGMRAAAYDFTMLGPRVPTIIVSPWVTAAPVATPFDHTSIPRTVRKVFGIDEALSDRERAAATFDELVTTSTARRSDDEMPNLQAWLDRTSEPETHRVAEPPPAGGGDYARSLGFLGLTLWQYVQSVPEQPFGPDINDPTKKRARKKALRKARSEALSALGRAEAGNSDQIDELNGKLEYVVRGLRNDAQGITRT